MEILQDVLGFLGELAVNILGLIVVVLAVAAFWTALGLLGTGIARVYGFVSGRLAERRGDGAPPMYWLTLLVRFDEHRGRFSPSVQLRGHAVLSRAWIRLELVDAAGTVRIVRRRRLAPTAIGTELSLPAFEPPDGASAEEVLGWHWDVVIEDKEGERGRWREHPRLAGYLNAEAELAEAELA